MTGKVYSNHISCPGKIAYPSRVAAMQAAQRFGNRKQSTLNAYQCTACQQWHIGRQNTRNKRPKATL